VLENGWFCTNDIMRRSADGFLWLEGRAKEILHCAGEKLSPEVLEQYIAAGCPVTEVAVVGIQSEYDLDEIVAVIVPATGADVTLDAVRRACEPHVLSGFVPKRLVAVDGLPWKAEGKLDRAAVRRLVEPRRA